MNLKNKEIQMRLYFFLFIILLHHSISFSQSLPNEVMPVYEDGSNDFIEYLKQVSYPDEAMENCIMGRVMVYFIVTKLGTIDSVKVVKGVHPLLDSAAVNHIKNTSGHWTPGRRNDTTVNVKFTVPFNFILTGARCDKIEYFDKGVHFYKKGKYDKAIKNFKKAINLDAYYSDALYNCALSYLKMNDRESACHYLNLIKSSGKTDADKLLLKYCSQ